MKKNSFFLLVILISLGGLLIAFADIAFPLRLSGSLGSPHSLGSFSTFGNAGSGILIPPAEELSLNASGVYITYDGSNYFLTGHLFLETVGWVQLGVPGYPVTVDVPTDTSVASPWKITGSVWNSVSGWITLDSLDVSVYSGVYVIPGTPASFSGYAWSDTLGYIDFSGNATGDGLFGQVKIIGNAGGLKTYDSLYVSNNGVMRTNSVLTSFINTIKKNVALLTRNAPNTMINSAIGTENTLGEIMYFKLPAGGLVALSTKPTFCTPGGPRSIIVDGGDVLIDRDVSGNAKSCAIVALSNGTTGGSVYLDDATKVIESYIVTEGSLFGGTDAANLYNDTRAEVGSLPQGQLYILGGIISRNTIGGAITDSVPAGACPYTETNCDWEVAIKYDLNFFRNYRKDASLRAYKNNTLDNYSFIIEYDSRAAGDPPPGL